MNILTFSIEKELFGIDLMYVKEINRNVEYTRIPRSAKNIVGLFNMRGQIITLFNLAYILGYSNTSPINKLTCVILDNADELSEQKGFIIDKGGDVLEIPDDICEIPPPDSKFKEGRFIKFIVKLESKILSIIDLPKLLNEVV